MGVCADWVGTLRGLLLLASKKHGEEMPRVLSTRTLVFSRSQVIGLLYLVEGKLDPVPATFIPDPNFGTTTMSIIKLRAGKYRVPVTFEKRGDRFEVQFAYNGELLDEIRNMEGAKWHGYDKSHPRKVWSFTDSQRNRFQLSYLVGEAPYAPYEMPLIPATTGRPLYTHQLDMKSHGITRHQCILGGEMGTGKTLAAIEIMEWAKENCGFDDWLWVGPRSALEAVHLDFIKWGAKVWPEFHTYESLRVLMEGWPAGKQAPRGFVGDEISRAKNPTAKRSQAVRHLTDSMRKEYGRDAFVLLMSGTPAPKSPADWWNLCEIACPGFLKEGDIFKFKRRLAVIENMDSITGGTYPKLIAWRDSEDRCGKCGRLKDNLYHDINVSGYHMFVPGKNEVAHLYKRMSGLVLVKFKKDCLDLPDKTYRTIKLKPSLSTLQAAKLIVARSKRAIQALTLLRELSDGFNYIDLEVGTEVCKLCSGSSQIEEAYNVDVPESYFTQAELVSGVREVYDEDGNLTSTEALNVSKRNVTCPNCDDGLQIKVIREAVQVECPKEQALKDIVEDHEDIGRLVVYAGFTGSVDRCCKILASMQWGVIRVDGRGWTCTVPDLKPADMLRLFQDRGSECRLAFVGQPSSAGMGLTLTASPTIVYYSNDFNAESRSQSEDRIHRIGMDKNRGATIIDFVHLDTDQLVLDNLKKKKRLQDMTMGQLSESLQLGGPNVDRD